MVARLFALFACGLLMAGCVRSIEPVLKDEQVGEYPQIAGKWVQADEPEAGFEAVADGSGYKINYVDEKHKTGKFVARVGKVGELTVMELRPGEMDETVSTVYLAHLIPTYSFFVVTQLEPELRGKMMKMEWVEKYLQDHAEELSVIGKGDDAVTTASTEQLQALIQKHWPDKDAWSDEIVFVRSGSATKPAGK